jgi:4-carboxymuconolactone decarboxylase
MSDKREKALAVMKQMLPPDIAAGVENPPTTGFGPELNDLAMTMAFEPLWARDGLDLRTRSLVNCAILITLRAHGELAFHAPAAIRNGATIQELEEVVYHSAGYAGFPAAVSAREAMSEALKKAGMID